MRYPLMFRTVMACSVALLTLGIAGCGEAEKSPDAKASVLNAQAASKDGPSEIVMISQLTSTAKSIISVDPVSKQEIEIVASQVTLEIYPDSAVAVLVAPPAKEFCADQWNAFCKYVRLYESDRTANVGISGVSSAVILPIDELLKIAITLSRQLWGAE